VIIIISLDQNRHGGYLIASFSSLIEAITLGSLGTYLGNELGFIILFCLLSEWFLRLMRRITVIRREHITRLGDYP
jgi:small basic protein